jgi:hypothetical protein
MIISIVFFIAIHANSQLKIGIRGGLNWSFLKANDILEANPSYDLLFEDDLRSGYHIGVITQAEISDFFIQPELLFTSNKSDVSVREIASGDIEELIEQKFYKIDLPVLVGYKFGPVKLEAGPVGTLLLKNTLVDDVKDFVNDFEQKYKTVTFGYQAGLGVQVSSLTLDLKYEGGFGKLSKSVQIDEEVFKTDSRMSQIILSVGIFF